MSQRAPTQCHSQCHSNSITSNCDESTKLKLSETGKSKSIKTNNDKTSESKARKLSIARALSINNNNNKNGFKPFVLLIPKTMNDIKYQRKIYWQSNEAFIGKSSKKMGAISIVNKSLSIV